MNIHLHQRAIPDHLEAVNLPSLDHEDVSSASFKRLSVYRPYSAPIPDKLDLIIGMTMRPRTLPRQSAEQKYGNSHVSLLRPDKFVGAPHKRQLFLTHTVHSFPPGSLFLRCPSKKGNYKLP